MTARKRTSVRGEEGAAAVEFAIVVTLLFTIIFGIMEFGLAFFQLQNLRSAAREGARSAAIGGTSSEISSALVSGASGSLPSGYSGYQLSPSSGCTSADQGDEVKVTIPLNSLPANVKSAFTIDIPFIPQIVLTPTIAGSFRCE